MYRSKTYIATPPGEVIREQLAMWEMTQKEFSARMDMSEKHISKLINGEVHLTNDVALRLEMVLGIDASFWNNLERIFREKLARAEEENIIDEDAIFMKKLPVKDLIKNGWIQKLDSLYENIVEVRQFFKVARLVLLDNPSLNQIACRRMGNGEKSDYALLAIAQKARQEALAITTEKLDTTLLRKRLDAIRSMTLFDLHEFRDRLVALLAECGVALVILPNIQGSYLHGATFLDGKKVVVALTLRNKYADTFWFSLLHEIGHIVNGDIYKSGGTTEQDEANANMFAGDTLIPEKSYLDFVRTKNFKKDAIINFAKSISIDTGIVVGRLQNDKKIRYATHNGLRRQYIL